MLNDPGINVANIAYLHIITNLNLIHVLDGDSNFQLVKLKFGAFAPCIVTQAHALPWTVFV